MNLQGKGRGENYFELHTEKLHHIWDLIVSIPVEQENYMVENKKI